MGLFKFISRLTLGAKFRQAMDEIELMKKKDPELKESLNSFAKNYEVIKNVRDRLKSGGTIKKENEISNSELIEFIKKIPSNQTNIQWDEWRSNLHLPVNIKIKCEVVDISKLAIYAMVNNHDLVSIQLSNEMNINSLIEVNKGDYLEVLVDIVEIKRNESPLFKDVLKSLRFQLIEVVEVIK
jgi:FtsZ-binding cell division protein ZapB